MALFVLIMLFELSGCVSADEAIQSSRTFQVVLPRRSSVWVANGRQRKIVFDYAGEDIDTWNIKLVRRDGIVIRELPEQIFIHSTKNTASSSSSSLSSSPSSSLLFSSSLSSSSSPLLSSPPSSSSPSSLSSSSLSPSLPQPSAAEATVFTFATSLLVNQDIEGDQYFVQVCGNLVGATKNICVKSQEFVIEGIRPVNSGNEQEKHEDRFVKRRRAVQSYLSEVNLDATWPVNGTRCTIHTIHRPSKDRFTEECMKPGIPCVITGVMDDWQAMKAWQFERLQNDPKIQDSGIYVGQHEAMIPLSVYYDYIKTHAQKDKSKWMVFMPDVFEIYPHLLKDYKVPDFFSEDDDFMTEVDEELRLDWRWIIMAPRHSGSGWHVDPANTTGWLALVAGAKLWGLYPPSKYHIPGVKNNYYQKRDYEMDDAFNWWLHTRPYLSSNSVPLECVQQAGQMVFIPSGWWHSVVNLDDTVAVTQNFCNKYSFKSCLTELKEQTDSDGIFIGRTFEQLRDLYSGQYPQYFDEEDVRFQAPEKESGKTVNEEKERRLLELKKFLEGKF